MKRALISIASLAVLILAALYMRQIIHETIQTPKPDQHYVVALGDSVAAGAGLSSGSSSSGCDLADNAFPFLLGQKLHEPVEQFACSGATVGTTSKSSLQRDQYPAAKPFLTGSDVVIYAGANDIGWLQSLTSCAQTECDTTQTSAALSTKLQTLQNNLARLLTQVQQAHPRKVVVNTYYNLLATGDTCFARLGITPEKVSFINTEEATLNATITTAATQANATTVAVDFGGHTLCSSTPWIQNITSPAPLHPTTAGQQHIATQDAEAFNTPVKQLTNN